MKPLPLWSLSKTPETSAYALSSPSRTTSLLVSKKSDGRISHDSRENEDSLSLKIKTKPSASHSFSPTFSLGFFLCFIPSFLLLFVFLISFLILFHFLFHFLFISSFLFEFLSPFWSIDRMGQKEETSSSPSSSQMCGYHFSFFFFHFIIPLYDIITYMTQCEPWNSCHPCGSM